MWHLSTHDECAPCETGLEKALSRGKLYVMRDTFAPLETGNDARHLFADQKQVTLQVVA